MLHLLVEMGDGGERAHDAVLVKAVPPIGAAEIRATRAIDLGVPGLSGDGSGVEHGVLVSIAAEHTLRRDSSSIVERHAQLRGRRAAAAYSCDR
jgi:hypothetical protein